MHCAARRTLLIAAGAALALPLAGVAGCARRVYRIVIFHGTPEFSRAFRERLRELGYIEGQNLAIDEVLDALQPNVLERLPQAAAEAARMPSDLILAGGGKPVIDAIRKGAPATPLVFVFVDIDPVAAGIVASLSRPGGNITGVYSHHVELAAKRLQLLIEAVPAARRVAVLYDASTRDQFEKAQEAAQATRVTLLPNEMEGAVLDFDATLRRAARQGADSVLILSSGRFFAHRALIVRTAGELRLPTAGTLPFVETGVLLAYGPSFPAMLAQAADQADRILRGRKPADLAIEQVDRIELVVNLKTARELGIVVPEWLLRRADRVIR